MVKQALTHHGILLSNPTSGQELLSDILALNRGAEKSQIAQILSLQLNGYLFGADLQGVIEKPFDSLVNRG